MLRLLALPFLCALIAVLPADAESYQLKSGETLADSKYETLYPVGGGKRLVLQVTFAKEAESPELRTASLVEILQRHLLPKATKEGYSEVAIWESLAEVPKKKSGLPFGLSFNLTFGAHENYDFELQDEWVWKQVAGPDLDLSIFPVMTLDYDDKAEVYRSNLFRRELNDGSIYYEVWVHAPDTPPGQLAAKANAVFRDLSGCTQDGVPIAKDSFLAKRGAKALIVYGTPVRYTSPLQLGPRVRLQFGHVNGVPHCFTHSGEALGTWDDIYASLSE